MKINKFMLFCILTLITIAIELIAMLNGEKLVIITILSTLPVYILTRIKTFYGILSYICISILLYIINPHQMIFFTLTNGILGILLAIFQSRSFTRSNRMFFGGMSLAVCLCICLTIIGKSHLLANNWYWTILIIVFCLLYTAILSSLLNKSYLLFRLKCHRYLK